MKISCILIEMTTPSNFTAAQLERIILDLNAHFSTEICWNREGQSTWKILLKSQQLNNMNPPQQLQVLSSRIGALEPKIPLTFFEFGIEEPLEKIYHLASRYRLSLTFQMKDKAPLASTNQTNSQKQVAFAKTLQRRLFLGNEVTVLCTDNNYFEIRTVGKTFLVGDQEKNAQTLYERIQFILSEKEFADFPASFIKMFTDSNPICMTDYDPDLGVIRVKKLKPQHLSSKSERRHWHFYLRDATHVFFPKDHIEYQKKDLKPPYPGALTMQTLYQLEQPTLEALLEIFAVTQQIEQAKKMNLPVQVFRLFAYLNDVLTKHQAMLNTHDLAHEYFQDSIWSKARQKDQSAIDCCQQLVSEGYYEASKLNSILASNQLR